MPMKVEPIKRQFRYNGITIPDPNPELPTSKVLEALSSTYPELSSAKLEPPTIDGGFQTFNIRIVAGTKG